MLIDIFKKAALLGLGIMSLTEEKLKELIKEMEEKGEVSKKEGEDLLKNLLSKVEEERRAVEDRVRNLLKDSLTRMDIASREDFIKLEKRVHALEKRVKELMKEE